MSPDDEAYRQARQAHEADMDALITILGDEGVTLTLISPARPFVAQGHLADGARCDIRAFGDRVGVRVWPPTARWQRTLTDGDGTTRTVPHIDTAIFFETLTGWRWGDAAALSGDELHDAITRLIAAYMASRAHDTRTNEK